MRIIQVEMQQLLQYQNQVTMLSSKQSCMSAATIPGQTKRNKQSLLIAINIGSNKHAKQIIIEDIVNTNKIDEEIKMFMSTYNLKKEAFQYIKSIIQQQIQQQYSFKEKNQNTKCNLNCHCNCKTPQIQQRQRKISNLLDTENNSSMHKITDSLYKRSPQNIRISINSSDQVISTNKKEDPIQSFVFNSSFTLPSSVGQKDRMLMTDQIYKYAFEQNNGFSQQFTNMSEFQTAQHQIKLTNSKPTTIKLTINKNQLKPQSPCFKKVNNQNKENTPQKTKIKVTLGVDQVLNEVNTLSGQKKKKLSTKQRKQAIMTPRKPKNITDSVSKLLVMNAQNLQLMVSQHKRSLKQKSNNALKSNSDENLTQNFQLSTAAQHKLKLLFLKLTNNNPPKMNYLHSQYVSYQQLTRQQLHFMGLLFQKIDHRQLNSLNYEHFRTSSIKHCWQQLQQMSGNNLAQSIRNQYEVGHLTQFAYFDI